MIINMNLIEEGGQLLKIKNVKSEDLGNISCTVTTAADSVTSYLASLTLKQVK